MVSYPNRKESSVRCCPLARKHYVLSLRSKAYNGEKMPAIKKPIICATNYVYPSFPLLSLFFRKQYSICTKIHCALAKWNNCTGNLLKDTAKSCWKSEAKTCTFLCA